MSTIVPAAAESFAIAWRPLTRALASAAVVWHLVGVMVAPITTPPQFTGPPSILGTELKKVYGPYITATFLDHSYKFFAPNPGDSHLLRYDLYFADGTKRVNQEDQILPDRRTHWPRLLYHRHFMLTEFINDFRPPWAWETAQVPPREAGQASIGETVSAPQLSQPPFSQPAALGENIGAAPAPSGEAIRSAEEETAPPYVSIYVRAIAEQLARRHGATRVDLYYRKHLLPSIEDFNRVGRKLDTPESYRDRLILSYTAEKRT